MPLFVIAAKFGIQGSFVILYTSTPDLYPYLFVATANNSNTGFWGNLLFFTPALNLDNAHPK